MSFREALIAAKLLGNGGGGGGGGGLPPIERTEEELVNGSFDFEQAGGSLYATSLPSGFTLAKGEEYVVSWDSANYTCICGEIEEGSGVLALGNLSIMGPSLPDTEEPFIIVPMGPGGGYAAGTPSSEATHDIIIAAENQSPPEGALLTVKNGEWAGDMVIPPYSIADVGKVLTIVDGGKTVDMKIAEAQTITFEDFNEAIIVGVSITPDSIRENSSIIFTLDNVEYELSAELDPYDGNRFTDGTNILSYDPYDSHAWELYIPEAEGSASISDIEGYNIYIPAPPKLSFEEGGGGEVRLYCDSADYILNDISYDSDGNQIITSIPIDGFDEEENLPFATVQSGRTISAALTGEDVGESSLERSGNGFRFATIIGIGPSDYQEAFFTMPTDDAFLSIGSGGSSGEIAHGTLHIVNNSSFNAYIGYTGVGDAMGLEKALYYETITLYARSSLDLWFPLARVTGTYTTGCIGLSFQSAIVTRDRIVTSQDGNITIIGRDNDSTGFIVKCSSSGGTEMTITIS